MQIYNQKGKEGVDIRNINALLFYSRHAAREVIFTAPTTY